jgi:predicted naringenin-chalcone synthase/acyl carrier protein
MLILTWLFQVGEIWLHSASKAAGYYNKPDLSNEVFRARVKNNARLAGIEFLRTGDLGFLYKDELFFVGRHKDLIIINGANYYPQDIERSAEECTSALRLGCSAAFALKQEGDVSECAVLIAELKPGVPASQYEEIVESILAAVSLQQGLYLSGVVLLKLRTILKTTSGKISRASCRDAFLAQQLSVLHQWDTLDAATFIPATNKAPAARSSSSSVTVPPSRNISSANVPELPVYTLSEVTAKISAMVSEVSGIQNIPTDMALMDSGMSSFATTELSVRLSKEFGVKIRPTIVFTSPTIDDVSLRVVELMEVRRAESQSGAATAAAAAAAGADFSASVAAEVENEDDDASFVRHEAYIAGWGIATPFPLTSERFLEVDAAERRRLGQSQQTIDQMATFVKSSRINNRFSCHPFFLPKDKKPSDFPGAVGTVSRNIYEDHPQHWPTLSTRMQCFQETAVTLCVSAAENAVKCWGKDRGLITHLLTTCTSGWSEPGIGCAVIKGLGLSQDVQKAELNFNGCFCGATCLRLARDIIRAGDATAVLIVACEVATTHFDWSHTDPQLMIAQSLFADGAGSIVVAREGIWKYTKSGSSVVPNSGHLLGLRPPFKETEHSYVMTLSKLVAPSLYAYFSKGHGKDILKQLYDPREQQKPALAIHPGGPRILEAVGDVFWELGWQEDALQGSYDTFGEFGNLGSAAMLFVLAHRLSKADIKEDKLITMAFGPGVTVEWATLERAKSPAEEAAARNAKAAKRKAAAGAASGAVVGDSLTCSNGASGASAKDDVTCAKSKFSFFELFTFERFLFVVTIIAILYYPNQRQNGETYVV